MTVARSLKVPRAVTKTVGVIASADDLVRAQRLRRRPDFFELRLDGVVPNHDELDRLSAPLIITARAQGEGGLRRLTSDRRTRLLREFLPVAAYVDIELGSAAMMNDLLGEAKSREVKRIISVHDFSRAAKEEQMQQWLSSAREFAPDIFKLATRTDSRAEVEELIAFFERNKKHTRIAAMGIGKLGPFCRRELVRRGSALAYGHLGSAHVEGQLSLAELRRFLQVTPSSHRR
jgi:3-dehydroquinate dehydratase-1